MWYLLSITTSLVEILNSDIYYIPLCKGELCLALVWFKARSFRGLILWFCLFGIFVSAHQSFCSISLVNRAYVKKVKHHAILSGWRYTKQILSAMFFFFFVGRQLCWKDHLIFICHAVCMYVQMYRCMYVWM